MFYNKKFPKLFKYYTTNKEINDFLNSNPTTGDIYDKINTGKEENGILMKMLLKYMKIHLMVQIFHQIIYFIIKKK